MHLNMEIQSVDDTILVLYKIMIRGFKLDSMFSCYQFFLNQNAKAVHVKCKFVNVLNCTNFDYHPSSSLFLIYPLHLTLLILE